MSAGLSLTGCMTAPPSRQSVLCPVCGRLISQRRNLNQHMRTHQMITTDDVSNHAEMPQVSVLPMEHVQIRYGTSSRASRNGVNRPLQQMEEMSNAPEIIISDPISINIEHKTEPHYS